VLLRGWKRSYPPFSGIALNFVGVLQCSAPIHSVFIAIRYIEGHVQPEE
jgi:hypothetical protein